MPKRFTAEMKCDRCGRTWHQEIDITKPNPEKVETFSLQVLMTSPTGESKKVDFSTLCDTCAKAVAGYVEQLDVVTKASPQRKPKAKKEAAQGAPAATPEPPKQPTPQKPGGSTTSQAGSTTSPPAAASSAATRSSTAGSPPSR